MLRTYYRLTKPGIIYGNAITLAAGFFLASRGNVDWHLLLATILGSSLIVASACVANNVIDRGIDAKMARTKKRALVTGKVTARNAVVYSITLGLVGSTILAVFTNLLTVSVALFGLFAYVVLYGIGKRRSIFGTEIGSISGALPPVIGYVAVAGRLDGVALILFLIVVFWQMPHFYAIAIYRLSDYKAAGLPVLPAVKGMKVTKQRMLIYMLAFVAASLALAIRGYAGGIYLLAALMLGLTWLILCIQGFSTDDDSSWARQMFRYSLVVITVMSIAISFGGVVR